MSKHLKDQFNNIKIEYLKLHNKTLCARRKNLYTKFLDDNFIFEKDEICDTLFELTLQIDANGKEILRLRGNKWSI